MCLRFFVYKDTRFVIMCLVVSLDLFASAGDLNKAHGDVEKFGRSLVAQLKVPFGVLLRARAFAFCVSRVAVRTFRLVVPIMLETS